MKLALGTAQFGLNYGISNQQGQVALSEIEKILLFAKSVGITTLDTASAYGESENILGKLSISQDFDIVSKISALKEDEKNIAAYLTNSLHSLNSKQLNAVMFHNADDLLTSPYAKQRFLDLIQQKKQGKVKKIGVSVYTPEQVNLCLKYYPIDIVQLPLNCLDQRFIKSGCLTTLAKANVEIHCRSVFLQGLLLMVNETLDDFFIPYLSYLKQFWQMAQKNNLSLLSLALSIASKQTEVNKIVVGCCTVTQLEEIVKAYETAENFSGDHSILACNNDKLIIPSNWQTGH
ncbi:MAG: aldo/keto reductase [Alteromonadaceae bacterium]|nr:aldo/keto reductase [Alteromonadaceae bacterium]